MVNRRLAGSYRPYGTKPASCISLAAQLNLSASGNSKEIQAVKPTLFWMQSGGCGGDTMALLNAESPDIIEARGSLDFDMLYHPCFSARNRNDCDTLVDEISSGRIHLDVLCLEGAVIQGPGNTGLFETINGKPKKDLIRKLAAKARYVFAIGTCASFGGVTRACEVDAVGLQFSGKEPGGFLGSDFRTSLGLPVINLPGCPVHPSVLIGSISGYVSGNHLPLNSYHAPLEYFSMLVHQGCTRNEYHEFQVEETDFGQTGCLFYHMGCHGPLAHGSCNKFLWNNRNCKTRNGVPCFGCTEPDFPTAEPFFETPNIVGLPINLPDGVDRPYYLAYKGMAAAAAPERLKHRKTKV
jgi:hydrogenase small subunit